MGFLDDYDVDLNEFESSGFDVPDGQYNFEVTSSELKEGTQADPDARHIVVKFSLENEDGEVFAWNWWLRVPSDPARPTNREKISMSDWKKWLLGAGFTAEDINTVGPEDVESITGTMRLVSSRGKGANKDQTYQNPKDWTFDGAEEEPARPAKSARAAKPAPAAEAPKAAKAAKSNPFAKAK